VNNFIRHIVASMISLVIIILLKDWDWIPENHTKPITNWIFYYNLGITFINTLISLSIVVYVWMGITKRFKKLHNYLIKSFFPPFVSTFFIAVFILFMQFLWKWVDELVGKGLEIDVILKFIFYSAARLVPLSLPIAVLIASLMTIGNLGEKYELSAIKSAGISLRKILNPLLLFSVIIALFSYFYSDNFIPYANLKNGTLLYDIQKKKPTINIREGEFYNGLDGYSIKVKRKDSETNKLYNILIYDHSSKNSNDKVIVADSGEMKLSENEKFLELTLYNGSSYIEVYNNKRNQKFPHQQINFEKDLIRFDLATFGFERTDENIYKGHYSMMSSNQLSSSIDSLNIKYTNRKEHFKNNIIDKFHLNKFNKNKDSTSEIINYRSEIEVYDYAVNKVRSMKALLKSNTDDLNYRKTIIVRHKIEWHRKLSLAFACIILFIIGSSLGAIIRKGGFGIPILVSILFFVIYHVINTYGEKQAKELLMDPTIGMWLANLIFLPISLFLLYKATTDSSILDLSYYKNPIINLIYGKKSNKSN